MNIVIALKDVLNNTLNSTSKSNVYTFVKRCEFIIVINIKKNGGVLCLGI